MEACGEDSPRIARCGRSLGHDVRCLVGPNLRAEPESVGLFQQLYTLLYLAHSVCGELIVRSLFPHQLLEGALLAVRPLLRSLSGHVQQGPSDDKHCGCEEHQGFGRRPQRHCAAVCHRGCERCGCPAGQDVRRRRFAFGRGGSPFRILGSPAGVGHHRAAGRPAHQLCRDGFLLSAVADERAGRAGLLFHCSGEPDPLELPRICSYEGHVDRVAEKYRHHQQGIHADAQSAAFRAGRR